MYNLYNLTFLLILIYLFCFIIIILFCRELLNKMAINYIILVKLLKIWLELILIIFEFLQSFM
jgi:hypothetical protein